MSKDISIEDRTRRAIVAYHNGQLKSARKGMEQSLKRAKKLGAKEEINVLKPFAFMYYERKEFDKAKELFSRALQSMDQELINHWDHDRATIYSVLGLISNAERNVSEADRLDKLALEYANKSADWTIKANLCTSLATRAFEENRTTDAILYYEQSLVEMRKGQLEPYELQIKRAEEILLFLYGRVGRKDDRDKLRKQLLSQKITQYVTHRKLQPLPDQPQPPGWALDTMGCFLETAKRNVEASFVLHKELYESLVYKDAQFRLMDDVIAKYIAKRIKTKYPDQSVKDLNTLDEDALEIYFFHQAHSSFLGAVRLALSGQIPQAQMVLRGLLENSMYCFRIHHNQQLKSIWLNRVQDPQPVKDNFTTGKIWTDFKSNATQLYGNIFMLYNKTVDDGAHPNVNAFLQHSVHVNKEGYLSFTLNYLNPAQIENCLNDTAACAAIALEIFDMIFDTID